MNKKGFTLVEIMAVVAIIAIVAIAAIAGVNLILQRQKVKAATMSEKNIAEAAVAQQSEKSNIYLPACIDSSSNDYINITQATLKKINDDLRLQMAHDGKTTDKQKEEFVKDYVKTINDNTDEAKLAKKKFSETYIGAKDLNCFKVTSVAELIESGYLKDLANGCDRASLVVVYIKGDSANPDGNIKSVQETGICK